jgi:TolB protein
MAFVSDPGRKNIMCRQHWAVRAITSATLSVFLCACGDGPTGSDTGSIQVETQTAAATAVSSLDTDGYTVVLDSVENQSVESNGTVTFGQVTDGEHTVELQGLQDNCTTPTSPETVTVVGGGTVQVSFTVTCWPPVSGRIVFDRTRDDPALALATDIWVMDADGTNFQQLTDEGDSGGPMWSPDGSKIVYCSATHGLSPADIWVMNADGTERTILTHSLNSDGDPSWSPDGSKIAFTRYKEDSDSEGIYVMNADGSDVMLIRENATVPAWSPDGSKIAFNCDTDVCVMNSDGTGVVNLTNTRSPLDEVFPGSWSPDGEKILFDSNRLGGYMDIFVMNADGTNPERLTYWNVSEHGGSWSPDGTKIVFYAGRDMAVPVPAIYYINADGTGLVSLTEDMTPGVYSSQRHPHWSPGT